MATSNIKLPCNICKRRNVTYKCDGCEQSFCPEHLVEHQKLLTDQLNEIEDERNIFKQEISQYQQNTLEHSLYRQINEWEQTSIALIKRTAQNAKQTLDTYIKRHIEGTNIKLSILTNEIKQFRDENDFNEIHLNDLMIKLVELREQFNQSDDIEIEEKSILVKKIKIVIPTCEFTVIIVS